MLALVGCSFGAHAVGLGNLDIRSYLGEPLNLRIGVITQQNEEIDTNCFAVINVPGSEANVSRRDVRLTLVETRNSRHLEVRGANAFNEPIGRLSIRAGCQAEAGVVRDYSLLLDPAPLLAPAVVNREPAPNATPQPAQAPSKSTASSWTVYDGDTLSSLARGIYPASPSRQAQYIAALRTLNPSLAGLADNSSLPVNSELVLPDLKTLSGKRANAGRTKQAVKNDAPSARSREARGGKPVRRNTAATAPAALPTADVRKPAAASEEKNIADKNAVAKAPEAKKVFPADSFKLRISGGDLDLSRSQGITDETRTQLRERFAALDADDQTAQLLALKNTVKQIEKRLNEMQLKMATLPISGTVSAPQAEPPAVAAVAPITPTAPSVPTAPPVADKPAAEVSATAKPAPPPPAAPPKTKIPKASDSDSSSIDLTTWLIAGLSALALAALAWWALKRRGATASLSIDDEPTSNEKASSDEFNTWVNEPDTTTPSKAVAKPATQKSNNDLSAKEERAKLLQRDIRALEKTESAAAKSSPVISGAARTATANESTKAAEISANAASPERKAETVSVPYANTRAAVSADFTLPSDALAAPLEQLDYPRTNSKSDTSVDSARPSDTFDLDLDLNQQASTSSNAGDQISEDRLRRLRYMHERYPELAARTVSIDEPESVIHAARLYYEDNQLGKACELLIYAVEERPQESRFWLAQFELFRLEKMSPQFTDLAHKFQLLFADTESWPKVRKIGFDLDPANPLFTGGTTTIETASENWLGTTAGSDSATQNISAALIADLRTSLFAEHRVAHADYERGPNLLHAMGVRA
jgi:hypothetical protein